MYKNKLIQLKNNLLNILHSHKSVRIKYLFFKILKIVNKYCIKINLFFLFLLKPINIIALSSENPFKETLDSIGSDLLDAVNTGAVKAVLVITALRLTAEYTRGGSKYKFIDILKQCAIVLFILISLPILPKIVNLVIHRYLPC